MNTTTTTLTAEEEEDRRDKAAQDRVLLRLKQQTNAAIAAHALPIYLIQYNDGAHVRAPLIARLLRPPYALNMQAAFAHLLRVIPPTTDTDEEQRLHGAAVNAHRPKAFIPFVTNNGGPVFPRIRGVVVYFWMRVAPLPERIFCDEEGRIGVPRDWATTNTAIAPMAPQLVGLVDWARDEQRTRQLGPTDGIGRILCSMGTNHPMSRRRCWNCDAVATTAAARFGVCGLCRVARYCSRACQTAHWRAAGHATDCAHMRMRYGGDVPADSALSTFVIRC